MDEIKRLLENVADSKTARSDEKVEVSQYNIFDILEVSLKEVIMCRFLADLLNPCGSHGYGNLFLNAFLTNILKIQIEDKKSVSQAQIVKEYVIDEKRRIDIVIILKKMFIPIEIKIYADEQESQCFDYYEFAHKYDDKAKVVYLTRFGTMPSIYSRSKADEEISEDNIINISFKRDICNWLLECEKQVDETVKNMINQYIAAIKSFTVGEVNKGVETADIIISDEKSFKAGLEIQKSMNDAKIQLIKIVFHDIEKAIDAKLKDYGLEKEEQFDWYNYDHEMQNRFYDCYSTYPGLNYLVKGVTFKNKDIQLWLRIEVEHCLFAGFCLFNAKEESEFGIGNQQDEIDENLKAEIMEYLNLPVVNNSNWWIIWKYLPTATTDRNKMNFQLVPNFKEMNQAAIELIDLEKKKNL